MPAIHDQSIAVFPTEEQLINNAKKLHVESVSSAHKQFLHLRNTLNPRAFFYNPLTSRNGFPLTITGFNWQDDIDEIATNVKFNLPVTSELRIQKTDNYGSELLE